jgi:hypothetical protein
MNSAALGIAQHRALGRKVSDEFTVPLCRAHHREVHNCGDETAWWKKAGIDPIGGVRTLWLKTHPLPATRGKMGVASPISRRGPNYKTKPIEKRITTSG